MAEDSEMQVLRHMLSQLESQNRIILESLKMQEALNNKLMSYLQRPASCSNILGNKAIDGTIIYIESFDDITGIQMSREKDAGNSQNNSEHLNTIVASSQSGSGRDVSKNKPDFQIDVNRSINSSFTSLDLSGSSEFDFDLTANDTDLLEDMMTQLPVSRSSGNGNGNGNGSSDGNSNGIHHTAHTVTSQPRGAVGGTESPLYVSPCISILEEEEDDDVRERDRDGGDGMESIIPTSSTHSPTSTSTTRRRSVSVSVSMETQTKLSIPPKYLIAVSLLTPSKDKDEDPPVPVPIPPPSMSPPPQSLQSPSLDPARTGTGSIFFMSPHLSPIPHSQSAEDDSSSTSTSQNDEYGSGSNSSSGSNSGNSGSKQDFEPLGIVFENIGTGAGITTAMDMAGVVVTSVQSTDDISPQQGNNNIRNSRGLHISTETETDTTTAVVAAAAGSALKKGPGPGLTRKPQLSVHWAVDCDLGNGHGNGHGNGMRARSTSPRPMSHHPLLPIVPYDRVAAQTALHDNDDEEDNDKGNDIDDVEDPSEVSLRSISMLREDSLLSDRSLWSEQGQGEWSRGQTTEQRQQQHHQHHHHQRGMSVSESALSEDSMSYLDPMSMSMSMSVLDASHVGGPAVHGTSSHPQSQSHSHPLGFRTPSKSRLVPAHAPGSATTATSMSQMETPHRHQHNIDGMEYDSCDVHPSHNEYGSSSSSQQQQQSPVHDWTSKGVSPVEGSGSGSGGSEYIQRGRSYHYRDTTHPVTRHRSISVSRPSSFWRDRLRTRFMTSVIGSPKASPII